MGKERIIKYSKDAAKIIKKQDEPTKKRLREAIEGLKNIPMTCDIRPLEEYKDGRMRLRVGGFRVIFKEISELEIDIVYNGHRKSWRYL